MVRYARMNGRPALWIPGTDHAGIATQVRPVEKPYQEDSMIQPVGVFSRTEWRFAISKSGIVSNRRGFAR